MRGARSRFGLIAIVVAVVAVGWAVRAPARATAHVRGDALVSSGQFTVLAEPQAGVGPFLAMIAGARHSIELTMYELTDPQVQRALAAAAHRGVDVRVLLNGGYYGERDTTNDPADTYLAAHGVHVRFSPTYFALTHQKTLTVDGVRSAIMTLNFDGLYPSTRDFAVLDRRPADVAAIVGVFDADWAGRRVTPSTGSGDLVWSPGAAVSVVSLIDSARHSSALEDEEMAYAPATSALCAAARRGVAVTIVMTADASWDEAFDELTRCGVDVRVDHGQAYYIHAKVIVVDDASALVSSQNLSTTSLDDNRELGVRLTTPALVHTLAGDIAADAAGAQRWTG
jgi:cardiolipin synthase